MRREKERTFPITDKEREALRLITAALDGGMEKKRAPS
jgi:hypothetical protein